MKQGMVLVGMRIAWLADADGNLIGQRQTAD